MNRLEGFSSGPHRLSCVCTLPDHRAVRAGLIFVHAADSNRLGPHRMFVELADQVRHAGIASLRFDMRGCGDSSGAPAGSELAGDIEDLLSAVRFFSSGYHPPSIFLFGISRGARVSLAALQEHPLPIDGAILLSTPCAGPQIAARMFSSRLQEYLHKCTDPASLTKLLSGRADLKQIVRTLTFALHSQKRYRRDTEGFRTRCPLCFIYGSKDPIAADSASHYRNVCEKSKMPFKMVQIEDANHSFFHYRWKEQIIALTESWLQENTRGSNDDGLPGKNRPRLAHVLPSLAGYQETEQSGADNTDPT